MEDQTSEGATMRRSVEDYRALLATAISEQERRNPEAREELYELARAALKADFRRLDPSLLGADISEERFKLNLAIHDFEFAIASGLNFSKSR